MITPALKLLFSLLLSLWLAQTLAAGIERWQLRYLDEREALALLTPLLGSGDRLSVNAGTVLIRANAQSTQALLTLLRELDVPPRQLRLALRRHSAPGAPVLTETLPAPDASRQWSVAAQGAWQVPVTEGKTTFVETGFGIAALHARQGSYRSGARAEIGREGVFVRVRLRDGEVIAQLSEVMLLDSLRAAPVPAEVDFRQVLRGRLGDWLVPEAALTAETAGTWSARIEPTGAASGALFELRVELAGE